MPHSMTLSKFAKGSPERTAIECSTSIRCFLSSSATPVIVWCAHGAEKRLMAHLTATIKITGGKSLKTRQSLWRCSTTRPAPTANRQSKGDQAATPLSVPANKSFVSFVGKNGSPTTKPMEIPRALDTSKLWLWIKSWRLRNKTQKNIFSK